MAKTSNVETMKEVRERCSLQKGKKVMANKADKDFRILVRENNSKGMIDIYVMYSQETYYLMSRRNNPRLLEMVGDGISIEDFKKSKKKMVSSFSLSGHKYQKGEFNPRLKNHKNLSRKIDNSLQQIILVAEEFFKQEINPLDIDLVG